MKNIWEIEKNDNFDLLLYPKNKMEEFDIESFELNLSISDIGRKLKESLKKEKEENEGINKKENKEITLQESKIESINLYGIKKDKDKEKVFPQLQTYKIEPINLNGITKDTDKDKETLLQKLQEYKLESINIYGKDTKKKMIFLY